MIFAELQGKLGQHHSRAHERAEDVLTSTVFGLLRYMPLSDWLGPLAGRIRPIQKHLGPKFPAAQVPQGMPPIGFSHSDGP